MFCPGQKNFVWDKKNFVQDKNILSGTKYFGHQLKVHFYLWEFNLDHVENFLSRTKFFCPGQKFSCPGQKIFVPDKKCFVHAEGRGIRVQILQIWLHSPYLFIKTYFCCKFNVLILKLALNEPNLPLCTGLIRVNDRFQTLKSFISQIKPINTI